VAEFNLSIDGVQKRVGVVSDGGTYTVTVDGRAYAVTDVNAAGGMLAYLVERESYIAHVSIDRGGRRLSMRGRNYRVVEETMDTDRPGAAAGAGDGRVEAPMPGTIVAVHVEAGAHVAAGDAVVVLESMKMQNEITAPTDGVVQRVHCRTGDQVGFGDVLVEVAPGAREEDE